MYQSQVKMLILQFKLQVLFNTEFIILSRFTGSYNGILGPGGMEYTSKVWTLLPISN